MWIERIIATGPQRAARNEIPVCGWAAMAAEAFRVPSLSSQHFLEPTFFPIHYHFSPVKMPPPSPRAQKDLLFLSPKGAKGARGAGGHYCLAPT